MTKRPTKRPVPTSGMAFRGEGRKGRRTSDYVTNYTLVVAGLVCLIFLIGVEPTQAAIISLLFGIFYTLGDIYLELKRKR